MASISEPVTFREFCPLYYLLNAIPTKIQKGFRSIVVYLTALDTNGDYIAVGSSIGMLYLYCRHLNQMRKYNFEGKTESITVVKLLSCFDDLVAAGTASGRVAVFQLVSSLPGRNKQLRRFDVTGIHKNSITALAWSPNGMKLFSGDDKGKIVYSSLDLDQGLCNSQLVLEEPSSIVQLDYSQKVLLVSTLQRSLLFYTEEKSVRQIGTQPRKSTGKFGACFIPGLCKQSDLTLYASRPGLRLWKADVHGTVQATFILKDAFAGGVKPFELHPRLESPNRGSCSLPERHLGLVSCFFQEGWVLSWNEYSIYLLDTVNQATIAGLEGSGDIVSVSCTENEIFFLKGDRNIIRISSRPEGLTSIVRDGLEMSGCSERVHMQQAEKLPGATVSETRLRGSSVASSMASEPRSRSSSLNSTDSSSGLLPAGLQAAPELGKGNQPPSQRFNAISSEDFDQELVVKPIKVKRKKKKKKTEGGSRSTCHSSLESTPCSEFPGDSPQSLNTDLLSMTSSVLGSSMDQLSAESPDLESGFSGEVNGVPQENTDPETFNVLEVPGSVPDSLAVEDDIRAEMPHCHYAYGQELLNGVREAVRGSDVTGLEDEPCPADDGPYSTQIPFQEQDSSLRVQDGEDVQPIGPQSTFCEAPLLNSLTVPSSLSLAPSAGQWLPGTGADEGSPVEPSQEQDVLTSMEASGHLSTNLWHAGTDDDIGQKETPISERDLGSVGGQLTPVSALAASTPKPWLEQPPRDQALTSSDEEDIYAHGLPSSSSETSVTELGPSRSQQDLSRLGADDAGLLKPDQFAESWMGYSGPGYGILSLVVSEKYIWCLDYKGGLFCSALPGAGLRWQKFEDAVQQVAVSPSGALLWKIEQKSNRAFACGKVTIKGKRHWYEALPQAVFVALSDDTAWIIRTSGDLYLQTGNRWLCSGACQLCHHCLCCTLLCYHACWESLDVRSPDTLGTLPVGADPPVLLIFSERQALEPVCITLGDQQTLWALDIHGNLWFRTGIVSKTPQGDDDHWWQFLSLTRSSCLLFPGTYWNHVVPRGTASATKWAFVLASAAPTKEGSFLWLCQSSKDLCSVSAQSAQSRPSTVQLPPDAEMRAYAACQDALWALDSLGQVFIRTLSKSCPTGMHWTRLDLSQLGAVKLTSLACGNQHIWACDSRGGVYFRVGTQPLNPSLMLPAWIMIEPPVQPAGVNLVSVHSSPNDQMLWVLDSRWNVHVRTGITEEMPVGTAWEQVPGLQACQLALSTRTVWARCPNGDLARRYGITDKNPAGDYWKKIPGSVACCTVTASDELWAVGPPGYLLRRLTKTFSHSHGTQKSSQAAMPHPEDLEDEWEVI
ncbi:PREDICTED: tectonin beta-propeller repeat-containing protein 2 [Rhinopithecus bieti]|uniref:tectonin beta-propeller repeat-containing protein 2 n=1 Tax=Rhinopithecus bieti TaxID=61621 RepID=UPI00083C6B82|nr:PREDICTED: tectonin beta-propeller repeat-containing protein 2 [Rhinopithecus bieti]